MKAYKGFNKDMTCRGFQYKEGETYETSEAKLCECGFHACEAPLDALRYYPPATSEFHEVELDDISEERQDDTKVCAKKIKIGAKLSIEKLIELQIKYKRTHCTNEHKVGHEESSTVGDGDVAMTGAYGAATAGAGGVAMVGSCGSATTSGCGVSSACTLGAATTGNGGVAKAGAGGVAKAGSYGVAKVGDSGVAEAGAYGVAVVGACGVATAGVCGVAEAGKYGAAVSRGSASVDEDGLAFARGNNVRARGKLGSIIVIIEEMDDTCDIYEWKVGVIDGVTLKPNTWYKLENGEFVECDKD